MADVARLLSLNVGLPRDVAWNGKTVHTGVFKHPVDGPRMIRTLNIDGDGQGDLAGHGGEMRAVLVYQRESYEFWRRELGRDDLEYGQFGENLTVDGLADDDVHIGDRLRIGDAELEVTQPRVTCYRVGFRLGEPTMPSLLVAHHRPGFYCRVITEGLVRAGDEITRTRIGRHAMTVAAIDGLLYLPDRDIDLLRKAIDIPALSPGWQGSFHELLHAAEHGPAADAAPAGVEPSGWPGFRPLRVTQIVRESSTVSSIHLSSPDGDALPRPAPGQYLTLRVVGAGDPPPVRNYSLSSGPSDHEYRISVKRESPGIVSTYLDTQLRVGDLVDVAAPRGDFVLHDDLDDHTPVLLVSAGVGATPVLAMLHALAAANSDRDIWWLHTARSPEEQPFGDEAHGLMAGLERGHEVVYYTRAAAGASDRTSSRTGRLDLHALEALGLPTDATAYLCGPSAFMTDIGDALVTIGLAADHIHTEVFGAQSAINPGLVATTRPAPHQPPGPTGSGPRITFGRSGLTVAWRDADASILELAETCDVPTRWSCRTGVCHTCQTLIISGSVRYDPSPLEAPPPGSILTCCSRPDTDLTLEL
jgi:ferredoxin-NADP reductase/MOSC domain-containing protein YiiM